MLFLFKKKYFLKDILPENYIDIHNHLLPNIDDGAKTVEETNILITQMKLLNIKAAIATPHTFKGLWNNTKSSIKKAYKIATAANNNQEFLKNYASEYMLDSSLLNEDTKKKLLVLPKNYLLIEISQFNNPLNIYELLFELKNNDYNIILAHPERYIYLQNSLSKFLKLKQFGISFQLNLLSLTGYYGKKTQKTAIKLLENDMYDFTGTDIHSQAEINQFKNIPLIITNKKKMDTLLEKNSIFL